MYGFDFEIGDRVAIREWEDMENEYGLDLYGDIDSPGVCFIRKMAPICGSEGIISGIDEDGVIYFNEGDIPTDFIYSVFMVYHLDPEEDTDPIPESDFLSILSLD